MKGTKTPETTSSIANVLEFWFNGKLLDINTLAPVKVIEVNSDSTVDVELLIQGIDADNNALPVLKIYNCPFSSVMSGAAGIVLPPKKGDIGIMGFCQRDITKIRDTKNSAIPDTLRKFSLSDGIYLMSILKTETDLQSIIKIDDDTIEITTKELSLGADNIDISGNAEINIDAPKVITLANNQNAVSILKEVSETLANACALPTAPGQPVITPADLLLIQTKLGLLTGFE